MGTQEKNDKRDFLLLRGARNVNFAFHQAHWYVLALTAISTLVVVLQLV